MNLAECIFKRLVAAAGLGLFLFSTLPKSANAEPKAPLELFSCQMNGKYRTLSRYYQNQLILDGKALHAVSVHKTLTKNGRGQGGTNTLYSLKMAEGHVVQILENSFDTSPFEYQMFGYGLEGGTCGVQSAFIDHELLGDLINQNEKNAALHLPVPFAKCSLKSDTVQLYFTVRRSVENGTALIESVSGVVDSISADYVFLAKGMNPIPLPTSSNLEINGAGSFTVHDGDLAPLRPLTSVVVLPIENGGQQATLAFGDDRLDKVVQQCELAPGALKTLKQLISGDDSKVLCLSTGLQKSSF